MAKEPERHRQGKKPHQRRWRNVRAAKVTVGEPLAHEFAKVMTKEGVSDLRLRKYLGISDRRMLRLRRSDKVWATMELVRRALHAMGYELTFKLRKFGEPYDVLVVTHLDVKRKNMRKLCGSKASKWNPKLLWQDDAGGGNGQQ